MSEDYYKTLGVSREASDQEIQKAYRDLARKYHPDMNPDDKSAKEKFQKVQQAFDVLTDSKKREMYDRYGSSFESMGQAGPQGGWGAQPGADGMEFDFSQFFGDQQQAAGNFGGGGFADILNQFRGGTGAAAEKQKKRRKKPARGADIIHSIEIPFNTAVKGGHVELSIRRASGNIDKIEAKIPAGIEDNKKIRLRGQGEAASTGATDGDLIVTVRVAAHPFFTRRGNNLDINVPITLLEAALGAKIDIPTPDGDVTLTIPPGTSSGKRLRLKGRGINPAKGTAGDLLAEIQIILPEQLDEESQQLVKKFADANPLNPRDELRW